MCPGADADGLKVSQGMAACLTRGSRSFPLPKSKYIRGAAFLSVCRSFVYPNSIEGCRATLTLCYTDTLLRHPLRSALLLSNMYLSGVLGAAAALAALFAPALAAEQGAVDARSLSGMPGAPVAGFEMPIDRRASPPRPVGPPGPPGPPGLGLWPNRLPHVDANSVSLSLRPSDIKTKSILMPATSSWY